jgi:hypothetical protein
LVGRGDKSNSPCQYSKAFDNFVQGDSDLVGLLAYSLFKRAIREEAEQGKRSDGNTRNPSKTVVSTYRQAAERELSEVISASIEAAKPDIQGSAALSAVEGARADVMEHVTNRTGFLPALVTNILAWAFTLVITVLILLALNRPDPAQIIQHQTQQLLPQHTSPNSN